MKTLAIRSVEPTNCLVDGGIVTQISPILNKLERQRGWKRKTNKRWRATNGNIAKNASSKKSYILGILDGKPISSTRDDRVFDCAKCKPVINQPSSWTVQSSAQVPLGQIVLLGSGVNCYEIQYKINHKWYSQFKKIIEFKCIKKRLFCILYFIYIL